MQNKYLKGALLAAGVAGLALSGVGLAAGLAAGTMAVSVGFTAGGVALGALRGGAMGALMSRQDSRTSAVRGFGLENGNSENGVPEAIRNIQLKFDENGNVISDDQNHGVADVVDYLTDSYAAVNATDRQENRKRTAISAGVGAAMGALMSGVHINDITQTMETSQQQVGTTPESYNVDLSRIDIHQGSGMSETFSDLGGNPNDLQRALDIAEQLDAKWAGFEYGSNGAIPGFNGVVGDFAHTYPGTIDTWPDAARAYTTELAQQWAAAGLIPAEKIGGQAVFNAVEQATTQVVPNAFYNLIAQASAMFGAGVAGSAIGNRQRRNTNTHETPPTETPQPPTETPPESPQPPTETPPENPNPGPTTPPEVEVPGEPTTPSEVEASGEPTTPPEITNVGPHASEPQPTSPETSSNIDIAVVNNFNEAVSNLSPNEQEGVVDFLNRTWDAIQEFERADSWRQLSDTQKQAILDSLNDSTPGHNYRDKQGKLAWVTRHMPSNNPNQQ